MDNENQPQWITAEFVQALHDQIVMETGGREGVISDLYLGSALTRPQTIFHYGACKSIHELAAMYAEGIVTNHPFHDGNKRTAFMASIVFLERNGLQADARLHDEYVRTIEALASGQAKHSDLVKLFEQSTTRIDAAQDMPGPYSKISIDGETAEDYNPTVSVPPPPTWQIP